MRPERVLRILFVLALSLAGRAALAQSVAGCGTGNQDSTCLTRLSKAPEVAPTCTSGAGWTTIAPAQWIGSGYSQPQCNFQPEPSCPSGDSQQTPPTWNGEEWVGQVCVPQTNPCPFGCAGDGMPFPLMLGYCAEVSQTTILRIVHFVESCTTSMAGAVRVNQAGTIENGNGTLDYWNTPSSFTTTSTQTFRNTPGPAGTVVQSVELVFGDIQYDPDDCGCDASPFSEGSVGGGSSEGWDFACPAAHPTINFATVAAYGESNPALIECH